MEYLKCINYLLKCTFILEQALRLRVSRRKQGNRRKSRPWGCLAPYRHGKILLSKLANLYGLILGIAPPTNKPYRLGRFVSAAPTGLIAVPLGVFMGAGTGIRLVSHHAVPQ